MTAFEYLAAFVSIVVGLAVVRLLRGVVSIAVVYAVIAALVPEDIAGRQDYQDYYYRARRPVFGTLALLMVMDGFDSALKGPDNLERLGPTYFPVLGFWFTGHVLAAWTDNRRYHAAWVVAYFLVQTVWSMGVWAGALPSSQSAQPCGSFGSCRTVRRV